MTTVATETVGLFARIFFAALDENAAAAGQNFVVNIVDVQIDRNSPYHSLIGASDYFFTSLFTFELIVNIFANWLQPFLSNSWNLVSRINCRLPHPAPLNQCHPAAWCVLGCCWTDQQPVTGASD